MIRIDCIFTRFVVLQELLKSRYVKVVSGRDVTRNVHRHEAAIDYRQDYDTNQPATSMILWRYINLALAQFHPLASLTL